MHTDRETDRQQPTLFFLLPLSCLLFCSFLCHTAVLLFSLWDETQDSTLCLSDFNICLTLPHSPNTSITSSADFFPIVCPYLCSSLLCVQSVSSNWAVFSLPLCSHLWLSFPMLLHFLSFSFLPVFFLLFVSHRIPHEFALFCLWQPFVMMTCTEIIFRSFLLSW